MANGKVYVFNVFSEPMRVLSVNGGAVGTVPAWSAGGQDAPPIYTAASFAVERVRTTELGRFFNGTNTVLIDWPSDVVNFQVAIDGLRFPLTQDLVIQVVRDRWALISSTGAVVAGGSLVDGAPPGVDLEDLRAQARVLTDRHT